ncbi:MAG: dNTP triphosphohydrolase [Alloprevotella sp.]|nr:dNTP triphosphohydrolase [Alloprevotella sp.]
MDWNRLISYRRLGRESAEHAPTEMRTEFQRDYDRLIFSSAFRRMQNKTQVFPLPGSIFVHNRLTHSLEVSSVGRSLGTDVGRELLVRHPELADAGLQDIGAIVSAACLAHDMGNPPFGHSGERAIYSFFSEGSGKEFQPLLPPEVWSDVTRFDGNANAFRLLTHQFNGHRRGGFVLTYSTLASIVKYPFSSTLAGSKNKFGFFAAEREDYLRIGTELGLRCLQDDAEGLRFVRHPLVYLVEAADDICYQIMDIEDAHKLRLLSDELTEELLLGFFEPEEHEKLKTAYPQMTDFNDRVVYYRSCVINALEQACVRVFLDNEEPMLDGTFEGTLIKRLPERLQQAYKKCSKVAVAKIYNSKDVTDIELAGYHIIYTLMELMTEAVRFPRKSYSQLLISQASPQYELMDERLENRIMAVLDYLSGMTDVFALDLYRKISGQSLPNV